jgi:hypothetical protein
VSEALGKAYKTLGEGFAECDTRQRKLDELYIGNDFFVEYFLSGTRQSVTLGKESSTNYISATTSLSSTFYRALGRVSLGTRQRKAAVMALGNGDGAYAECHKVVVRVPCM